MNWIKTCITTATLLSLTSCSGLTRPDLCVDEIQSLPIGYATVNLTVGKLYSEPGGEVQLTSKICDNPALRGYISEETRTVIGSWLDENGEYIDGPYFGADADFYIYKFDDDPARFFVLHFYAE